MSVKKSQAKIRSQCPISFALDLFGDKWSLLVLRDIIFKDKCYYHEFASSDENISTNILADRLAKLECHGLILKVQDQENKKKFIYSPTAKALDLVPMLAEMILWSAKHDPDTGIEDAEAKRIAGNKKGFIKRVQKKFKHR